MSDSGFATAPAVEEETAGIATPPDGATDGALRDDPRAVAAASAAVDARPDDGPSDGPATDPVVAPDRPVASQSDPKWEAALARARWIARLGRRRWRPDGTREDWLEPAQRAELERRGRVRLAFYKAADAFAAREGRAPDKPGQRRLLAQVLAEEDAPRGWGMVADAFAKVEPELVQHKHGATVADWFDVIARSRPEAVQTTFEADPPYFGGLSSRYNQPVTQRAVQRDSSANRTGEDRIDTEQNSALVRLDGEKKRHTEVVPLSADLEEKVDVAIALNDLAFERHGVDLESLDLLVKGVAKLYAEKAISATLKRFGEGNHADNSADAYRHAHWTFNMTRAFELMRNLGLLSKPGAENAKNVGDAYERSVWNEDGALLMDLFNNRIGRELAQVSDNKGRSAEDVVGEALDAGLLRVFPFQVSGKTSNISPAP